MNNTNQAWVATEDDIIYILNEDGTCNTVQFKDAIYDAAEMNNMPCTMCGVRSIEWKVIEDELTFMCRDHWYEYCRGETDWWELIRLMREAKDE